MMRSKFILNRKLTNCKHTAIHLKMKAKSKPTSLRHRKSMRTDLLKPSKERALT